MVKDDFLDELPLSPKMRGTLSKSVQYNRLVRDRIPEIVETMGNIALWDTLDDESFAIALRETVVRVSQQFRETESLESLCDLMDAVEAWLELRGLTWQEVAKARQEKRKRCGSYGKRLFLKSVVDGEEANFLANQDPRC